jgi:hypothetical protein
MADYFFSRHNVDGFSANDNLINQQFHLINVLETEYCDPNNPTYDNSKCDEVHAYLEKTQDKITVDAKTVDVSDEFSYEKMKTWNIALGIAFLSGYLYYKNY